MSSSLGLASYLCLIPGQCSSKLNAICMILKTWELVVFSHFSKITAISIDTCKLVNVIYI